MKIALIVGGCLVLGGLVGAVHDVLRRMQERHRMYVWEEAELAEALYPMPKGYA